MQNEHKSVDDDYKVCNSEILICKYSANAPAPVQIYTSASEKVQMI